MHFIGFSGLHNSVAVRARELPGLSQREQRIVQGLDSAAALVTSQGVVAAAAEERFTREKGTGAFPRNAIRYCLDEAGLQPSEIDVIAHGFSYEPHRELFEQDPFLHKQFNEVYSHEAQIRRLNEQLPDFDWAEKFVPVPHHLAHAASAFYPSGFSEALIVVVDGMGEVDSMTIAHGSHRGIDIVRTIPSLHSLGVLYGVVTLYLGFFMALDEYKVMGLAPYGNPRRYFPKLMQFVQLKPNGTYSVPLLANDTTLIEKETHRGALARLTEEFGPPRDPDDEISQHHMDIASALQAVLQASLMHILRYFKRELNLDNLCLAGGVALNCSANGAIKRSGLFKNVFVQPAAGDDGTALGAALYAQSQHNGNGTSCQMTVPLWGPGCSNTDVEVALQQRSDCKGKFYESRDALNREIAARIAAGQIVGWCQGRMEFGPRALGSRSILADPRDSGMRDRINALVKKREGFRPFAPAVIAGAASRFFDVVAGDEQVYKHMLYVVPVRQEYREQLPAITHIDGSARVQTVTRDDNPRFWGLIDEVGKATGMPVVLNTSFNVRRQPIVCTAEEAIDTFVMAQLDALAIEDYLVVRGSHNESVIDESS